MTVIRTYVEATRTQQLADFVMSTIRALKYFGVVPEILVPDQLRSAVSGPDRHDPEINPTYAEMAAHYGTAVIPARPRKPRDKAKVENGVLIAQRWILACLRRPPPHCGFRGLARAAGERGRRKPRGVGRAAKVSSPSRGSPPRRGRVGGRVASRRPA